MDVIVAPATARFPSAIAIIRVSGEGSLDLFRKLLKEPQTAFKPFQIKRCQIVDETGEILDDLCAIFYPAPRSYTGEEMIEIFPHGNPLIVQKIIDVLKNHGARLAEPGEFTERAFLNGKIDLTQAESINLLIQAPSLSAIREALRSLQGEVKRRIEGIIDRLVEIRSHLEAVIDFPEDEIPEMEKERWFYVLQESVQETERLLQAWSRSKNLFKGVRLVIVGIPNAGKSSLLNRLLRQERALVHDEAGTTRDYIEDRLMIEDLVVSVIDTAGLRETSEKVEKMGIEKTYQLMKEADGIIHLIDGTVGITALDRAVVKEWKDKIIVQVWNKKDLKEPPRDFQGLAISCLSGEGIEALEREVYRYFQTDDSEFSVYVSDRQKDLLLTLKRCLQTAEMLWREDEEEAVIGEFITQALRAAEELTGRDYQEETLEKIFSQFCIGK